MQNYFTQLLEFWTNLLGTIPNVSLEGAEWTTNINSFTQALPMILTVSTILFIVILFFGGVISFFKIVFSILNNK